MKIFIIKSVLLFFLSFSNYICFSQNQVIDKPQLAETGVIYNNKANSNNDQPKLLSTEVNTTENNNINQKVEPKLASMEANNNSEAPLKEKKINKTEAIFEDKKNTHK